MLGAGFIYFFFFNNSCIVLVDIHLIELLASGFQDFDLY